MIGGAARRGNHMAAIAWGDWIFTTEAQRHREEEKKEFD
jgi:hypothetical protein